MQQLVTQAEFARMKGVSRPAVGKWIATGRIAAVERDGKKLIDPAAASVALKGSEQRAQEVAQLLHPPAQSATMTLTDHKVDTERERAALLKLERLEREGELTPRDQVALESETAARLVRKALDAIPSRAEDIVAAATTGGVQAVRKALKDIVREVENGLADAMNEAATTIELERARDLDDDADAA